MADNRNTREGCAGWFKWIVGTFVALLSAGGGIVALANFVDPDEKTEPSTPIVITIKEDVADVSSEIVNRLPEDIPDPDQVPTPLPIINEGSSNRPSEQAVVDFLYEAVLAETASYLYLDSSYVSWYFTGDMLTNMENEINDLLNNGVIVAKLYDDTRSYIYDINFIDDYMIQVDSCEYWSQEYYSLNDSSLLGNEGPDLYPQTITIEQFTDGWYITNVTFYEPPAFCN